MTALKWAVPINGQHVALPVAGHVVPIAESVHEHHTGPHALIWTVEPPLGQRPDAATGPFRTFKVFATGDEVPYGYIWRATAPRLGGMVWHVYEFTG